MRRNKSSLARGMFERLAASSFSFFLGDGVGKGDTISNRSFAVVVMSAVMIIILAESRTRAVQLEAAERDTGYQHKLDEMASKFHTRCSVSDRQLQQMERDRARLKAFEKETSKKKLELEVSMETVHAQEAKIASLEAALAKHSVQMKQLRADLSAEQANAMLKRVKDEDVHCKEVIDVLAGAKKNITEAEKQHAQRLSDAYIKMEKWKRKHASLVDELAVINARDTVAETQARVGNLQQSIALALALHHAAPNSGWKMAQRLARLKLDDEAKSDILSSSHRPVDEDELTARLNGLTKRLSQARSEHARAESRLESFEAPSTAEKPASVAASGAVGEATGEAASGEAAAGPAARLPSTSTSEDESVITPTPSVGASFDAIAVSCSIPSSSDDFRHDTFATLLMGISPSVIVDGMPGVLCVKQWDLLQSSVMISFTMSGIIAAAALGMFYAAKCAVEMMFRRVARSCCGLRAESRRSAVAAARRGGIVAKHPELEV